MTLETISSNGWFVFIPLVIAAAVAFKLIQKARVRRADRLETQRILREEELLRKAKKQLRVSLQRVKEDCVKAMDTVYLESKANNVSLRTHTNNLLNVFRTCYGEGIKDYLHPLDADDSLLIDQQTLVSFGRLLEYVNLFSTQKNFQSIATDLVKAITDVFSTNVLKDVLQRHRNKLHYNDRCEALAGAIIQGVYDAVDPANAPVRINRLMDRVATTLYDEHVTRLVAIDHRRKVAEEQAQHAKNRQQRSRRVKRQQARNRADRR